jgi:arylsulfatase A-like enzyme
LHLRRRGAAIAIVMAVALAAGGCGGGEDPAKPPRGAPNVLIIVTDDQRAQGTLRRMEATRRLFVKQGRSYPSAFATTPLCCPSRASILSGRYAHNHKVLTNLEPQNLDQDLTLERYLQDAGYRTGIYGKFLSKLVTSELPAHFDESEVDYRGGYAQLTDFLAREATGFLERAQADDERPWFLYVAPLAPHQPATPEPEYRRAPVGPLKPTPARSEADKSDKPPYIRRFTPPIPPAKIRARQIRALMSVDDLVGSLFAALRRTGESRRTLAFFMSDNGYHWGEHGLIEKNVPYTHSVRIPMLMRWPGKVEGGGVDDRLVANIDVAPTVLEATRVSPEIPLDGQSLLDRAWRRNRLLLEAGEIPEGRVSEEVLEGGAPAWASTRTRSYQYTEYYPAFEEPEPEFREYYDLGSDPFQLDNLLAGGGNGDHPPVARLSAQLRRDVTCAGSDCP